MVKTKKYKIKTEVISNIICDLCNKSCLKWADTKHSISLYEYATLTANWGYGSDGRDGESCESHLCQKCWEHVTSSFKNLKIESRF